MLVALDVFEHAQQDSHRRVVEVSGIMRCTATIALPNFLRAFGTGSRFCSAAGWATSKKAPFSLRTDLAGLARPR